VLYRKILAVALLAGLVAFGVGCTDDDDEPKAAPKPVTTVKLEEVGPADVISPVASMRPLEVEVKREVMRVTQRYFDASVRDPLTTGKRGAIKTFFTAEAAKDALGADRVALFDTGMPLVKTLKSDARSVQFTGYAGEDNKLSLIVAKFSFDVTGDRTKAHVVHRGELTLVPAFGKWFVNGYNVVTSRTTGGVTTTTKATS
jgi:hypothetical protein